MLNAELSCFRRFSKRRKACSFQKPKAATDICPLPPRELQAWKVPVIFR
jgi:hypothetical protein